MKTPIKPPCPFTQTPSFTATSLALCALACLLSTRGVAPTDDKTPPSVTGISADCAGRQLLVHFSEPLDPATAMDPANYSVSNGTVPVTSAKLQPGGTGVLLALASEPKGEGVLGVSNVRDEAGNAILAQRVGTSFVCTPTTMEVDEFSYTHASLTLINPNGGAEEVTLSGPMTVQVLIGLKGEAQHKEKFIFWRDSGPEGGMTNGQNPMTKEVRMAKSQRIQSTF